MQVRRVGLALLGIALAGVVAFCCTTLVVAANATPVERAIAWIIVELEDSPWVLCYAAKENSAIPDFDHRYGDVVDMSLTIHTLVDVTDSAYQIPDRPTWLMCTATDLDLP